MKWARHYQHVWEERSGAPWLPKWFRVASLAYGKHRANGHAMFGPGEVALIIGTVDLATGELTPDANVARTIGLAVEYGLLAEGSTSRCLIVPAHAIDGPSGDAFAPCPVHGVSSTSAAA